jgi:Zn-dependent protease/CBS domain-containing protein
MSGSCNDGVHSDETASNLGGLQVLGVPVRLHFTFLLLLALLLVSGLGGRSSGIYALYVAGLISSLLLHELGHAWVASQYGIATQELVMFPIGGVARLSRSPKPSEEVWISLAGPAVNLILTVILYFVATSKNAILNLSSVNEATNENLWTQLLLGNLAMAAFNLLPAFPMDGGRILRAALMQFKHETQATHIATLAGRMLAMSLALYALFAGEYLIVFASFFIYLGAAQEGAAAMGRSLTEGIPVRAAMIKEFHSLSHASTIRDAITLTLATSQHDFPVMHGSQVVGLLTKSALLKALASQGSEGYVAGYMDRAPLSMSPDDRLSDALPTLSRGPSCAFVIERDELVGLLTSQKLAEFLTLRRFGVNTSDILG